MPRKVSYYGFCRRWWRRVRRGKCQQRCKWHRMLQAVTLQARIRRGESAKGITGFSSFEFYDVRAKGTKALGKHVLSEQGEIKGAHASVAYAPKHAVHAPSQIHAAKHARHAHKEAAETTFDFTPLDEEPRGTRALSTLSPWKPQASSRTPRTVPVLPALLPTTRKNQRQAPRSHAPQHLCPLPRLDRAQRAWCARGRWRSFWETAF